jgi:hypothetical protein
MLAALIVPFVLCAAGIALSWWHSIFRLQSRATRLTWTLLASACFATAVANLRMAGLYLGGGCDEAVPATGQFVTALFAVYLPVAAVPGTLLLAILAAALVQLRRRYLHSPERHRGLFKLLHRTILRVLELSAKRGFILFHIAVVSVAWVAEPFLVLGTWHLVPPVCRDYRVFACCCAGLEVVLCIVRLIVRTSVLKELKYETALLRVDAMHVRYMEVTKCTRCGQQFFGSPEKGLGLAGEGRAQFVKHFFSQHGDTVTESDFTVEMRAAIASTDNGGGSEPNIARWHQQNDEAENAAPRQPSPGKNMPPNSRGQEFLVWSATGHPSTTPANSSVFRGDEQAQAGPGESNGGNNLKLGGAGGLAAAQQSARQLVQRPSVVERWAGP